MFNDANQDLKWQMYKNHLPQWRVALKLNRSANTLGRWLRQPMDKEHAAMVKKAIHELMDERKKVSE